MTKVTLPKWDAARTASLESIVGTTTPVTQELVQQATDSLGEGTTTRSVASKLRKMGYEVESSALSAGKSYTPEQEDEIRDFLDSNPNAFTYAEISTQVLGGSKSAKQIQGKILSMELYSLVKATEQVERPKVYTEAEEVKLTALVIAGGFIEDIAEAMDRPVNSIRGKILSMSRNNPEIKIPKQREYASKQVDAFEALGDDVAEMTVADIGKAIDKTDRGVKTILTHRGVDCKDYAGAKRNAKIAESKAKIEAEAA